MVGENLLITFSPWKRSLFGLALNSTYYRKPEMSRAAQKYLRLRHVYDIWRSIRRRLQMMENRGRRRREWRIWKTHPGSLIDWRQFNRGDIIHFRAAVPACKMHMKLWVMRWSRNALISILYSVLHLHLTMYFVEGNYFLPLSHIQFAPAVSYILHTASVLIGLVKCILICRTRNSRWKLAHLITQYTSAVQFTFACIINCEKVILRRTTRRSRKPICLSQAPHSGLPKNYHLKNPVLGENVGLMSKQ